MFFPFLLSIQLAVCSPTKPIEDGSNNDFDAFPATSDLIPDPSHAWTQTIPNFNRLDSQSQIVSQSQPDSRLLWASLNENGDGSEAAFTSAQGGPCHTGQGVIHRRDGKLCTLDRKTGGAKEGVSEGAQEGAPQGAVEGAREEGEGAQNEETPTIAPVWTPPNIYDPNWHKELDESLEKMRKAREMNKNLRWDDPTRCGDKWSFIPTSYSLHVCCDGVALGAGIYLQVENCDWRAFSPAPPPDRTPYYVLSLFSFYSPPQFTPRRAAQKITTSVVKRFW